MIINKAWIKDITLTKLEAATRHCKVRVSLAMTPDEPTSELVAYPSGSREVSAVRFGFDILTHFQTFVRNKTGTVRSRLRSQSNISFVYTPAAPSTNSFV